AFITCIFKPSPTGILQFNVIRTIQELKPNEVKIVEKYLATKKQFKVSASIDCVFIKPEVDNVEREEAMPTTSVLKVKAGDKKKTITEIVDKIFNELLELIGAVNLQKSGFVFFKYSSIMFNFSPDHAIIGSGFIPLSGVLKKLTKA
ncbi:MAG: hypothetical protein ACK559_22150, partial [bacterium]